LETISSATVLGNEIQREDFRSKGFCPHIWINATVKKTSRGELTLSLFCHVKKSDTTPSKGCNIQDTTLEVESGSSQDTKPVNSDFEHLSLQN
jgi:hypothetical protein